MSEWISVEDGLPDGFQVIARFMKPFFGVPNACYEMAYFEQPPEHWCGSGTYGWLYWRDNRQIGYPVTHWKRIETMEY